MANKSLFVLAIVAIVAATNGAVLRQEEPEIQLYYLTGLDGGVLTAHAGPESDGHAYPAAGHVLNQPIVEGNKSQHWALYDDFDGSKSLVSQENRWNEVHIFFVCEGCFPVQNTWNIEESETSGVVYLSSTFIGDDKKSYIHNNGLNERVTFGPLDATPGSSSEWLIVPVAPAATKN